MPWARLDDGFHDHPKVDGLSLAAVGLYTLCLTWAHRHRKTAVVPGHITEARVRKLAAKTAHALTTELLAAGLWESEPHLGGWVIHDFADYLPRERDPEELRESGRKGGLSKQQRAKQPASNLPDDSQASSSSRASAPAFPTRTRPEDDSALGGERPETSQPITATEPHQKATCTRHPAGNPSDAPCDGCRAARELDDKRARRDANKAQREAEAAARACTRCDGVHIVDEKQRPTRRRCDHRSGAVA